jgi:drug/metabolite transporter (DMT)-like permease
MYFTSAHLPAGILAVIVNTVPIITYIFALASGAESFKWVRGLSVILGFTGLMLLVHFQTDPHLQQGWHWVLLALLTPICFALCALYVSARDPAKAQYFYMDAAGMMIFSTLLLMPVVIFNHKFYWPSSHLSLVDGAILLEVILSSIGYFLLFHLIKLAGAVYYSFVGCVVALTGLFWGWLVFSETLTAMSALAVALIVLALVLMTVRNGLRKPNKE